MLCLTKWPLVFPVANQKAVRLYYQVADRRGHPLFGVPETLLSDRGTNLMSTLMLICKKLEICKLNTTTYHPECDEMVKCFNWTLKTALRKHASTYGSQWDEYLSGTLFAYRNVPHDSTGEKPSYLHIQHRL